MDFIKRIIVFLFGDHKNEDDIPEWVKNKYKYTCNDCKHYRDLQKYDTKKFYCKRHDNCYYNNEKVICSGFKVKE